MTANIKMITCACSWGWGLVLEEEYWTGRCPPYWPEVLHLLSSSSHSSSYSSLYHLLTITIKSLLWLCCQRIVVGTSWLLILGLENCPFKSQHMTRYVKLHQQQYFMNVLHIHIFIRQVFVFGCLRCDLLDDTGPSALVSGSGIGRVLGTCTVCTVHMPACTVHTHITVGEIMNIFTWGGGGQSCQRILEGDDDSILTQQCNKHTLNTSSVGNKTCFLICRWLQMMQNLLLSWVPGQMFDVCEVSYLGLVQKLRKYRRYKLIELMKLSKSRVNWVSILTQYMYSPLGKPSKKKGGFCPH